MKNYDFREPTHEWFECFCKSCGKTLPDEMDPVLGHTIHDGDKCPHCGAALQEHEETKDYIRAVAHMHNYWIRQERLEPMSQKFEQQLDKYGDMYCPCQLQQTPETVCPCRYMREQGACRCGLFMSKEGADNWTTM